MESSAAVLEVRSRSAMTWVTCALVFAATCIIVGLLWDISWHMTIGRDTFWTPAHMVIYLGGVLGGVSCGWLILRTTFAGTDEERAASVKVWGFRGPLGAWVTAWGAAAMLTSAPFDDWWHNAYGLDVEILSPPHTVLAAGMLGVILGAMLLSLASHNGREDSRGTFAILYLYSAGILLAMVATLFTEYSFPNQQHSMTFFKVSALIYPVFLTAVARGVHRKWAATISALSYMVILVVMGWVLPLFAARPMLGPIYNPVDHMVPPAFPLLLVIPAIAVDFLIRDTRPGHDWRLSALTGSAFLALFLVVQWFFSIFLIGPAADNRIFNGDRIWSYGDGPGPWRYQFWGNHLSALGLAIALLLAIATSRVGLWWGDWMSRDRR